MGAGASGGDAPLSKAFTREDDGAEPAPLVAPRAPLPEGVPNYVTERGLAQLRAELAVLPAQRASAERRAELERRIASAEVVPPPAEPRGTVRFGATITLDGRGGRRRYQIVGVDEAAAAEGKIAFVSPLARAVLGRSAGDTVHVRTPRGEEELEIAAVEYD